MSAESVLTDVLSRAGHNAPEILKAASTPRVKEILRANNNEAVKLGICGVPTYRVSEKTGTGWAVSGVGSGIVWGQDELAVVQDLIAGWKEEECQVTADVSAAHQVGKREGEKGYKSVL
jgi:2-hydroxychromene-2-carboxylate isomerase